MPQRGATKRYDPFANHPFSDFLWIKNEDIRPKLHFIMHLNNKQTPKTVANS